MNLDSPHVYNKSMPKQIAVPLLNGIVLYFNLSFSKLIEVLSKIIMRTHLHYPTSLYNVNTIFFFRYHVLTLFVVRNVELLL